MRISDWSSALCPSDLDLVESHAGPQHRGEGLGVLVESRGEADRVGEVEPEHAAGEDGMVDRRLCRAEAGAERADGEIVRALGIEAPQQAKRARKRVGEGNGWA